MTSIAKNICSITSQLPQGVRLVAVSKFHPVEKIGEAYAAGQRLFGENRAQELVAKAPALPHDIEWHFIGHLQKNKVRMIMPHVSVIQSVDSVELLRLIDREAGRIDRKVNIMLQLHVAQEETKSGFLPDELLEIANSGQLCGFDNVSITGLMAMASLTDDMTQVEREFELVETTFNALKNGAFANNRQFTQLSMGMSDDWQIAVRHGATLVRIGTAVFGQREY